MMLALWLGGISYRKDCLTDEGRVSSDWTFTILAPIPYVFRPSEAGCQVHTGTRVALDAVGIGSFNPPTEVELVEAGARGDADLAYWGKVKLILRDYMGEPVSSFAQGAALIDSTIVRLEELAPTTTFDAAHRELLDALRHLQALTPALMKEVANGWPKKAQELAAPVEAEIRTAIEHLDQTHARL